MSFIQLDRDFIAWDNEKPPEGDFAVFARHFGALKWSDIRERKRVIVLAEAGSGKSEELRQQAKLLRGQSAFAFYATVQDVAREGLRDALSPADQEQFDKWRASAESAWFFVDSIDEAKLDHIRLEQAFRKIAAGIYGHDGRAHVVLSGRYTDWEFKSDLKRFKEILPIPVQPETPEPEAPHGALIKILNNERTTNTKAEPEKPAVLLMLPLNETRARRFASETGITNVDEFIKAIESANLWSLVARPMDLSWLARYWRANSRFGSFAEMLSESITERLTEPNPSRARLADVPIARSWPAMERIGAALVFGRVGKLTVPDSDAAETEPADGFDLTSILPEWSAPDRAILSNKAVFDAATYGYARLHNDNEGTVRSFLTARWLKARLTAGAPIRKILDLLFAEQYSIALVRPSVRETAVWLAIDNPDVANEILKRDPKLLLLGGDPGSLPLPLRKAAITAVVDRLVRGEEDRYLSLDRTAMQRIVQGDFGPEIRALWDQHKDNEDVRYLLLLILELGRYQSCSDIAEEAVSGKYSDRLTNVVGQRALLATGAEATLARYVETFRQRGIHNDVHALWEGFEFYVPGRLSGAEFAEIAIQLDASARNEDLGLSYYGPRIIAKITDLADLQVIVETFASKLGPPDFDQAHYTGDGTPDEKSYGSSIVAAGCQWLDAIDPDEAPLSIVDATLRLSLDRFHDREHKRTESLQQRLNATPARRRVIFWRTAEDLNHIPYFHGSPPTGVYQLGMMGWTPQLGPEDVDWLVADLPRQQSHELRQLAISALMEISRDQGNPPAILDRIKVAAAGFPDLLQQIDAWLKPRVLSQQEIEFEREHARHRAKSDAERAKRDESYIAFIERLKADPDQLRHTPPVVPEGKKALEADGRLFSLWELLNWTTNSGSRYGIEDVTPIVPVVGQPVADAFRDGLIAFWPLWKPKLVSSRKPDKRNQINMVDCMGIAAVSVAAKNDPHWAERLSPDHATRAAEYATLELNGFPTWLEELAVRHPIEVGAVLAHEIVDDIKMNLKGPSFGVLQKLANAPTAIASTVVETLLKAVEDRPDVEGKILSDCFSAIAQGRPSPDQQQRVLKLALERFETAAPGEGAVYLATSFKIDPHAATTALTSRLDQPGSHNERELVADALPLIFGGDWFRTEDLPAQVPLELLVRLIEIAYGYVRVSDDISRPSGVVYSPGPRDFAERARDNAFTQLANMPGPAAVAALRRFGELEGFAIPPERIRQIMRNRALIDSERAPWLPGEAAELENDFDAVPQTPRDLQQVALNRLSDLQHDLENDDYSDRTSLKRAANEREVQIWTASKLRDRGGRVYSLEREPHVIDEKEPDIRLRSKCPGDVSLPIEVKVAESWSLAKLEEALDVQLGGRYLKDRDANHGVLLLVHQEARAEGWYPPAGPALTITQVVEHLQRRADATAAFSTDSPKAQVALLDVSNLTLAE